jgi:hypothetical protein
VLLIDRNNDPVKTVYYIAALSYSRISVASEVGSAELYRWVCDSARCGMVPYEFFLMAIDFLFLVADVEATGEGRLRVHRIG